MAAGWPIRRMSRANPKLWSSRFRSPEANGRSPRAAAHNRDGAATARNSTFIAPDGELMAVAIVASGSTFEAGKPVPLFQTRILTGSVGTVNKPQYAVARDGRFLINEPVEESTTSPITLLLNWKPDRKNEDGTNPESENQNPKSEIGLVPLRESSSDILTS